ncbi:MAG TPA: BTAD domain-containing putative transcriptional regulator [Actinomycetota bacterium]|nr:BTAD domain-containing putative transcriptional regulator [Actinomycetota bacterium]
MSPARPSRPPGHRRARTGRCRAPPSRRSLMEALARRGNLAEALRAYERLRVLLREELGVAPSPDLQAAHRRLLLQSADS